MGINTRRGATVKDQRRLTIRTRHRPPASIPCAAAFRKFNSSQRSHVFELNPPKIAALEARLRSTSRKIRETPTTASTEAQG
ncbi:hypothetical protein BJ138DRAFT_1120298 [Hygrophoropsis aurantiaca]|uniref:Uncharacterized protein n=1 Tax=Hygrophoropsis aurantiaca TaxID=72124 RepID=A0ACB7ZQS5_9AGAM|nr:hypothetical protein BJ138DRAFT_1120298 [Hygrophoropsis aurantiaca]